MQTDLKRTFPIVLRNGLRSQDGGHITDGQCDYLI